MGFSLSAEFPSQDAIREVVLLWQIQKNRLPWTSFEEPLQP